MDYYNVILIKIIILYFKQFIKIKVKQNDFIVFSHKLYILIFIKI